MTGFMWKGLRDIGSNKIEWFISSDPSLIPNKYPEKIFKNTVYRKLKVTFRIFKPKYLCADRYSRFTNLYMYSFGCKSQ